MKVKIILGITALCIAFFVFAFFKVSIISIPPNGYALEGRTIVAWQTAGLFDAIDSPDSFCKRREGRVNNMCRSKALMTVMQMDVIVKLPYFRLLNALS